jgi:hypothetical protein
VIEWVPTVRVEVVKLAFPEASKAVLPSIVPLFLNVTVPEGVPPPDELTLALKVTDWPNIDGFSADVIVTALGSLIASE